MGVDAYKKEEANKDIKRYRERHLRQRIAMLDWRIEETAWQRDQLVKELGILRDLTNSHN